MPEAVRADGADPAQPAGTGRAWFAFLSFAAASLGLMVVIMATMPEPSGAVALVYPPALTGADVLLRAAASGGRPIRLGRFDWIVVVAPEPGDADFVTRARAGGAIAVLNPWIAGGCSAAHSSPDNSEPPRS